MSLLFWIMDGIAAGWLTGKIMSSEGRDQLVDVMMGIAGAVAGGFLINIAPLVVQGRMIYTNLAAISGAVTVTALSRYVGGKREYGSTS
jgi:uncharacterized membrane protein YeaQ/YmgE (transglycosylase-associated protein family)